MAIARAVGRPCVVVDPEHAEKLHAREPGDLGIDWPRRASQSGGRRQQPNGPHERCFKESDRSVVPVNQPNKAEPSAAEVGEGRERTKENTAQSHTPSTQRETGVSQGLRGVRQAARERKRERFTALLHHVTADLLRESYYGLKRQAAPGVDGVRWREYETGLEGRIIDLHNRVHRGAYRAFAHLASLGFGAGLREALVRVEAEARDRAKGHC
jgi:hypothetical protein